jgi:hypothetical protein
VWKSDLLPLMMDGIKIPSTIINAILQENAGGNSDFVIFSS